MCPAVSVNQQSFVATNVRFVFDAEGNRLLRWDPPTNAVRFDIYRNSVYEFTAVNGIPEYLVENFVEGSRLDVASIFPEGTNGEPGIFIGPRSEAAGVEPITQCSIDLDIAQLRIVELEGLLSSTGSDLQLALDQANELIAVLQADLATAQTERDEALAAVAPLEAANAELIEQNNGLVLAVAQCGADLGVSNDTIVEQQTLIGVLDDELAACEAQLPPTATETTEGETTEGEATEGETTEGDTETGDAGGTPPPPPE